MPIAFKEWAVTVRALAEGEQLVTLRKGGIRETDKHFKLDHDRFFLYPTFDHQRNDLVRESHQPELRRALEEGVWADGEPPVEALLRDGGIAQPDRVRIRAWAEVAAHVTITDPRVVDALSPYYVWTTDYAEKRLAWKRRHPLNVLLLRTYRIPRPVTVKVKDEYGGLPLLVRDPARPAVRGHARCSPTTSSSAPPRRSSRSWAAATSSASPPSPRAVRRCRWRAPRASSPSGSAAGATSSARSPTAEHARAVGRSRRRRRHHVGAAADRPAPRARAGSTSSPAPSG